MARNDRVEKIRRTAETGVGTAVEQGRKIAKQASSRSQKIATAVRKEARAPTKAALKEIRTAATFARKALGHAADAAKTAGSAALKANEAARKAAMRSGGVRGAAAGFTQATTGVVKRAIPGRGNGKPASKSGAKRPAAKKRASAAKR